MGSLIKLDIDRKVYSGSSRIFAVCSLLNLKIISSRMLRSQNGNFHWIIELEQSLNPIQTVAIQALMGSDWKRECFNLLRANQLKDKSSTVKNHWNVLFKVSNDKKKCW